MSPPMPGYTLLASLMGAHPELAIFHRFASLNALSLLHLQAELKSLEEKLHRQTRANVASEDSERALYDRDWEGLRDSVSAENGHPAQWHTMQEIKDKLNEYNQTVLFQHMVAKIDQPNDRDLDFLKTWMKIPTMGNVYLVSPDSEIWKESGIDELLCIRPRSNSGWLTQVLTVDAVDWYHRAIGRHFMKPDNAPFHGETVYYSPEKLTRGLRRITAVVSTVLASLLPIASIVVLYLISDMTTRLVVIGIFTAVFSLGLGLLTRGQMAEIFSATAAFAAVQVVFVSNTNSMSPMACGASLGN